MTDFRRSAFVLGMLVTIAAGSSLVAAPPPVLAAIETTLGTASENIRQLAFDGDPETFFVSAPGPGGSDHFTLVLDQPVAVSSIAVATGRPDGKEQLAAGTLETSADGKTFAEVARLAGGAARAELQALAVKAIRIRPETQAHPLVIREILLASEPAVAVFKYPVEVIVDVTDAPEMKDWAEMTARICERAYPMINEELKSEGFKPRTVIQMRLRNDYRGVAAASGGRITGSVKFFKEHPDDVGAMVHETVHCVQSYRGRRNPGWLVEGVADYVRFFKFEPGKLKPLSPDRARYNGSYKVTAAFLAFVADKYDRELVRKLNKVLREGEYKVELWKELTGKTVEELEAAWRAALTPRERYF